MSRLISIAILLLVADLCASKETFTANLTSSDVIRSGEVNAPIESTALANFVLLVDSENPEATRLEYALTAPDFDFTGLQTTELGDDVTAVHLHTLNECAAATCIAGDTAGTRHVLNIFGTPREDDADLMIDGALATIRGVWDSSDANNLSPAPTASPNDFLAELRDGRLFIMIHTREFPAGAIGGVLVPEPSSGLSILLLGLLLSHFVGRRSNRTRTILCE